MVSPEYYDDQDEFAHFIARDIVNWFHSQIMQTTQTVNHGYYRNASFIAHCRRLQPNDRGLCHSLCDSLAMDNRQIIFTVVPIHDFREWPPFSSGTTRNTQHFSLLCTHSTSFSQLNTRSKNHKELPTPNEQASKRREKKNERFKQFEIIWIRRRT